MNTCKKCGKGYCPNRVKRVFGHLPAGFCSPQCFTKDSVGLAEFQKEKVREKFDPVVMAGDIYDKLYEHGYIDDVIAICPRKFKEAVDLIVPILKGEKA